MPTSTGVDINNKIVTVNASNLSGGSVTITGDYTLKLGKGMSESETVTANYSEGTLTTAGKSAGYTLANNSISYTAGTSKTINFSGVKGTNLTINTGAGNDTLTGGSGNDTFICKPNEGTDTIAEFAAGDLLQIVDGTFSDSSFKHQQRQAQIKFCSPKNFSPSIRRGFFLQKVTRQIKKC